MYRLTPKAEISARLRSFQERLSGAGIDAAVIVQNADLFYFTGSVQQGMLVVPASGEPVYFVRRVYERAREESGVDRVVQIGSPKEVPDYFRKRGMAFRSVGFELDVMPVLTFNRYAPLFDGTSPADVSGIIREVRAVKGPSEIAALASCGRKLSELLSRARSEIRPGMTETEICGILHGLSISGGHTTITRMRSWNQDAGLGCVISGPDAAMPSYADFPTAGRGSSPYVPAGQGHRALRENEPIILDLMWAQDGYLADMARTYVCGVLPDKLAMAHETAVKVLRNIESAIRPGAVSGDLYEIGVEVASHSPFARNFMGVPGYNVRFIGHGIGIEIDEMPFIARGMKTVLLAGMSFTLEPKFAFPEEGAVGLENTYLVTETGFEKLTVLEDEVIACGMQGEEGRSPWSTS
jgi:Xaa-Pro dipeptidase